MTCLPDGHGQVNGMVRLPLRAGEITENPTLQALLQERRYHSLSDSPSFGQVTSPCEQSVSGSIANAAASTKLRVEYARLSNMNNGFQFSAAHPQSFQSSSVLKLLRSRKLILPLCLAGLAMQASAAQRVTGEQLEQILSAAKGKPDRTVARQLYGVELTEPLSPARLLRCEADVTGRHAKQALMEVADIAAFLDPAAAEIPARAQPDPEGQRRMIALMVGYVGNTVHQLPNLYATRLTASFRDDLQQSKPPQFVGNYHVIELYRDAEEVMQSKANAKVKGLTTSGEFGPILGTALLDAGQGNLVWSHWEQGMSGPEAVFHYSVTAEKSHYKVEKEFTAYKGEIAVDPSNGTILRLVLRADNPLGMTADILVEYGPVELGGKTYICPLKSIAILGGFELLWLNDVVFEQYHLYRADSRILPGFTQSR
jgi:hypothetical protein